MVCDREAAADCVQEVFCTAAVQLTKLRDPDKLRPWLYAIARNEALRCIRLRRRERASDELPEAPSFEAGPDTLAARTELANLIAEAAGGLSDRDRSVLELSYRHGLDGPELAEALGVSPSNATKLVQRLRETIERSLGALLVARGAQRNPQECPELGAILANWDGHFNVLMRKRIARHIDDCATCERNRRNLVSPKALLGVVPILVAAPWWLRGQTLTKVQLTSADFDMTTDGDTSSALTAVHTGYRQEGATSGDAGADSQFDTGETQGRRSRLIQAIWALAVVLFVAMGLTFFWLHHQKTSVAPDVIKIAPTPPKQTSRHRRRQPATPRRRLRATRARLCRPCHRCPPEAPAPIYNPAPNAPIPTAAPPAQSPPPVAPMPAPAAGVDCPESAPTTPADDSQIPPSEKHPYIRRSASSSRDAELGRERLGWSVAGCSAWWACDQNGMPATTVAPVAMRPTATSTLSRPSAAQ